MIDIFKFLHHNKKQETAMPDSYDPITHGTTGTLAETVVEKIEEIPQEAVHAAEAVEKRTVSLFNTMVARVNSGFEPFKASMDFHFNTKEMVDEFLKEVEQIPTEAGSELEKLVTFVKSNI